MSSAPSPRWPPGCAAATRAPGQPPALDQRRQIEWQGRQAGHRLVVAVHQPNLRLFGDTDSRAQYGYRLITGAYTASLWRMTFGLAPRIEWDTRIKGRGAVGIGEADELIHHAQIAWMPAAERRRYALTGPPPPDWFTDMRPAPWIDAPRDQRGPQTGRGVPGPPSPMSLSRPDSTHPRQRKHRPMSRRMSRPRTPRRRRPPGLARTPRPAPARPTAPEDLIVGIADAARFLGYDKPDSFRRARTRDPIPGETRTPDGRPALDTPAPCATGTPGRKIVGNRTPGGGPD